jgi:hypothetical protein
MLTSILSKNLSVNRIPTLCLNESMNLARAGCVFYTGSCCPTCSLIGPLVELVGVAQKITGQPGGLVIGWDALGQERAVYEKVDLLTCATAKELREVQV